MTAASRETHLVELVDADGVRCRLDDRRGCAPGAGPAAPGVLGLPARRRRAGAAAAAGRRPRPAFRCAGPTPAAATRRPARMSGVAGGAAAGRGARRGRGGADRGRRLLLLRRGPGHRPGRVRIRPRAARRPAGRAGDAAGPGRGGRTRWVQRCRRCSTRWLPTPTAYAPWLRGVTVRLGRARSPCSPADDPPRLGPLPVSATAHPALRRSPRSDGRTDDGPERSGGR